MNDSQKWYGLLAHFLGDPQDRQRVANLLNVSYVTLTRWINGNSKPRPHNLRRLLDVLAPEQRHQLLEALPDDLVGSYPQKSEADLSPPEIDSSFYSRVLNSYCNLPRVLHFSTICDTMLTQTLKQLDTHQVGMEVSIAQCMPPSANGKIRSLRENMGRGTGIWTRELEQRTLFLGAEALAGYVVTTGRPRAIQNRQEGEYLFPAQWVEGEESAMAYPLMRADTIAGCLLFSSTQPGYFIPEYRQRLIQLYAELLTVVFDSTSFYDIRSVELGRMPSHAVQQDYLSAFRSRVSNVMMQTGLGVSLSEHKVWQDIEDELLRWRETY